MQRSLKHYNLDVVLAVGYRVRSHRGTQFRRWATERLREYLVKGFTLDDERLKQGGTKNEYFDEPGPTLSMVPFPPSLVRKRCWRRNEWTAGHPRPTRFMARS